MEGEGLASGEVENSQDDKGSNNDGSTASHSSEEFVKVNKDETILDEAAGDNTRADVEELPPLRSDHTEGSLLDKIDPRAISADNMASDSYLKDYYDQLPSETAEYTAGEIGDLLGPDDDTDILQPEMLPSQDPFESAPSIGMGGNFASELNQGGHPSFKPAPASSFEPEPVETITEEPELIPVETDLVSNNPVIIEEEFEKEFDQSNQYEFDHMASKEEPVRDDPDAFEPEAEPQSVIEPEFTPEVEPEVVQEETQKVQSPSSDIIETVRDIPAQSAVEDIETKPEKPPSTEQIKEEVAASRDEDPVIDLLYWRDVKKTAFVFGILLVMLSSLICFSVISVFSYAGLALLTVTVAFRLYKLVLQTLNGTQQPHPFQEYLDLDVNLSEERVHKYASAILGHLNCTFTAARDLLLVKNTISSLKFGVFLWLLTYVGALFNGLTLLIIDTIIMFTVPPIYEKYQTPIDKYYGIAREKVVDLMSKVKAKLPGAKKEKKTQ